MAETRSVTLAVPDDIHPRIALLFAQMEDVRADLRTVAGKLDAEALDKEIVPGFFEPGALLAHVAEAEGWWIRGIVEGHDADGQWRMPEGWCAPFAETLQGNPVAQGHPLEDYLGLLDGVRAHTRKVLAGLAAEDLSRTFPYTAESGTVYEHGLEWVLHHLVEHEAHHRGQLALMLKLQGA